MKLHDRIIYGELRNDRRFARLSWVERDFFQGLWCVADDFGRFEADAEWLRTVLYAPIQAKVSERDCGKMLVRVHEVGLVKLYTVHGRGYGKVLDFRQDGLRARRALYPEEEVPKQGELFPPGDADLAPLEGRKEIPPNPPPESGGWNASPRPAALKPLRARRPQSLDRLADERDRVTDEIRDILRPGGCAYNVAPTGAKAQKLEALHARLRDLDAAITRAREQAKTETA
jgi:hypothetical protein